MSQIVPVILSGGSGTRLWPLSRAMYPKQFITGLNGKADSLLAATLKRLPSTPPYSAPMIVCNNAHRFLVREDLERAKTSAQAILLEPEARNTAPAIAIAAMAAAETNPEAVLVVMPSDHVIDDQARFQAAIEAAAALAQDGHIVLFGIAPSSPNTGYGYIRRGEALVGSDAYRVQSFTEKPDQATAEGYLAAGCYFWNSGIFVFKASTLIDELGLIAPAILDAARAAYDAAEPDLEFLRLDRAAFASAPSISIDYAVIEKTSRAVMLGLEMAWNDLGSWSSLWDTAPHDADGNFANGEAMLRDTQNCYIHSEKALVSTIGVRDLVIVETPDAILVADKSKAQDVGSLVQALSDAGRREREQHVRSYRPWGFFETLNLGGRFQVKLLHVKPGGLLSLQMHHHRSEHWIVVQGTANVTIDGVERLVRENESVYITATQWHRLENPGNVPLELIEVQIGSYLGEDDIIRSDDVYARSVDETPRGSPSLFPEVPALGACDPSLV